MATDNPMRESESPETAPRSGRALVIPRFGGPEVMEVRDLPLPVPQDDEVLVRVHAASVNPVDYKTREGQFPPVGEAQLPAVLGRDLAGTIETFGTRAHYMVRHGDPVFAFIDFDRGAQADYVIVKAIELCAIPDGVDMTTAAAIPLAAMTAWQGLFDHGGLQSGQRVLIHGGAGGVGQFAVQFARWKGAEVFATAGPDDQDLLRELGVDRAIDHTSERFEEIARDVDLVFDLVDGETRARSWGTLRQGGILVSTVSEPDQAEAARHGVRAAPRWLAQPNAAQLGEIGDLVANGTVKVRVVKTFPLDQAAAAQQAQAEGHVSGKIVLTLV